MQYGKSQSLAVILMIIYQTNLKWEKEEKIIFQSGFYIASDLTWLHNL